METVIVFFEKTDPVLGALYATIFTWGLTAFGASFVFLFKQIGILTPFFFLIWLLVKKIKFKIIKALFLQLLNKLKL